MARTRKNKECKPFIPPKRFTVQTRYEYWTRPGKVWCDWFDIDYADTENEGKLIGKEYKQNSMNPKMHLKDEIRVIENEIYAEKTAV